MYNLLSYFYKKKTKNTFVKGIFGLFIMLSSATNLNQNIQAKSLISQKIEDDINSKLLNKKNIINPLNTFEVKNRSYLDIEGPNVSLNFKQTSAYEILQAFAEIGGYNFVLINDEKNINIGPPIRSSSSNNKLITVSFNNENFSSAINSVLMAANLQGKLIKNTLYVGNNVLLKTFDKKISKVYTLKQSSASSAADFLASLGASISKVSTSSITSEGINNSNNGPILPSTKTSQVRNIETYGSAIGPLVGLSGTTDTRLQTIFLMGEKELIDLAERYLNQIDRRLKQVALSLKILDVNLSGSKAFENSFSWSLPNAFIVNNAGQALANVGDGKPPSTVKAGLPSKFGAGSDESFLRGTVARNQITDAFQYPTNEFYNFLSARITSSDTKIIASPTLILSENPENMKGSGGDNIGRSKANEAFVNVGNQVVTAYKVVKDDTGSVYCEPQFSTAGLSLGARVQKIDIDNYVSFVLEPTVSASIGSQNQGGCGVINTINQRKLQSGSVRVRDGETLILTGVISDKDTEIISKWPLFGDIPILGNLFKNKGFSKEKRELVILVTPSIIGEKFENNNKRILEGTENIMNMQNQ